MDPCTPQTSIALNRCSHLLLAIRRELQDLRRDVSEIRGLLVDLLRNEDPTLDPLNTAQRVAFPDIPTEIVDKFTASLSSNPPEGFQGLSSMPLKQGFDALVYHFAQVRHSIFLLIASTPSRIACPSAAQGMFLRCTNRSVSGHRGVQPWF